MNTETVETNTEPVITDMRTKVAKIAFLSEKMELPASDFEHMDIAQLSAQVKAVKEQMAEFDRQQAISPIIRPGEATEENESLRGNLEVGRVDLGDGVSVAVDEVMAYRGRERHPVTGAHQMTIINPKTGGPGIVTFEMRKGVWAKEPVAIVKNWRIKAQVLYKANIQVTNPTLGTQVVSVIAKPDYYLPLDLNPSKAMVERMANYIRGKVSQADETDRLTKAIAADLIP